jgi:diguanylate cyclase (GGDEF)-like protein/PAS domain S-box-containing protein
MTAKNKELSPDYQRQVEEAKSAAAFLDRLFNEISDSILVVDPQSYKILTFNQSALADLELKEAQLLGTTCHQLFYRRSTPCEIFYKTCPVKEILKTSRHMVIEYEYTNENNKLKHFEVSASPLRGEDGTICQIVFTLRNITRRKRAEQRKGNILEMDEITGLYNQVYFYKQLETEMARSRRHRRPLSLAIISIDNQELYRRLSLLNQHEFLAKVAKIISDNVRKVDTIYRYGEHDFAAILPETEGAQAVAFAKRLKFHHRNVLRNLKDINKLVMYSGFTLSVGIAEYDLLDYPEVLVKKAEEALRQARAMGNSIRLWDI